MSRTVLEWVQGYLYEILEPIRKDKADQEITEIIEMFSNDSEKNKQDLSEKLEDIEEIELYDIERRLHDSTRKWMFDVFYHRNHRTRHPAFLVFKDPIK